MKSGSYNMTDHVAMVNMAGLKDNSDADLKNKSVEGIKNNSDAGPRNKSDEVLKNNSDAGLKDNSDGRPKNCDVCSYTSSSLTKDSGRERETWSRKLDFILSTIGYAVGLGNLWRFPFLAFRNGGGAFLVPYVIMLVLIGLPIFYMELAIGQFASYGPTAIWKMNPLFKGVGIAAVMISFMVSIYYNVIIAYGFYYLAVSFINLDQDVPWVNCKNPWNTKFCVDSVRPDINHMNETAKIQTVLKFFNMSCINGTLERENLTYSDLSYNLTQTTLSECDASQRFKTPSEEYFSNYVLGLNEVEGFEDIGDFSLKLIFALVIGWIIVFLCLKSGIKTSGKVVYFTATCPYVVLLILLVRGLTLEGYWKGIEFYIIPKWEKLMNMQVWSDAASQIFYSLGPGFGVLITMSSYNKFSNNCYRDAIMVAIINCCTSVLAGFVIFSVLGFMAHVTNQPVEKVADSGPGLVFIAYPEGLAQMPFAPFWSILFFFMLLMLGLDSQFAMVECVICAIVDEFSSLRKHKSFVTFGVCATMLGLGLPCVTKGGIWIVTLMDNYTASYSLLIVAFFEFIGINWVYGFKHFSDDIYLMLGKRPGFYWKATWTFISPLIVVFIFVASVIQYNRIYYGDYVFPDWVQFIGWGMVSVPILMILLTMVIQLIRYKPLSDVWKPTMSWGPAIEENRTGRYANKITGAPNVMLGPVSNGPRYVNPAFVHKDEEDIPGNKQNGLRNGVATETASNTRMNPIYSAEIPEVIKDERRRIVSGPKNDFGY